jgi:large subunit ribosomal protein L4
VADEKDKTENAAETPAAKPARAPRKAPAKKPATEKAAASGETEAKRPTRPRAKAAGAKAQTADAAKVESAAEAAVEAKADAAAAGEAEPTTAAEPTTEAEPKVAKVAAADEATAPASDEATEKAKPVRRRAAAPAARRAAKAAPIAEKPVRKAKAVKARRPVEHHAPDARVAVVVDREGAQVEEVKLSADRFGLQPDVNLLHLAVRAEQAARRRGTASSKTRGEVSGSTAKLYRQKGTGRARAGSVKSPTRSGGGTAFGPHPRSFAIKINRKAAHKALAMALSDRAEGGTIYVARGLELDAPSTATLNEFLVTLDIPAPVLFVTDDEPIIAKSVGNLWYAEPGEVRRLSVEQVLRNRSVVVTEKAFGALTGA